MDISIVRIVRVTGSVDGQRSSRGWRVNMYREFAKQATKSKVHYSLPISARGVTESCHDAVRE
jgi:hypothetical protein